MQVAISEFYRAGMMTSERKALALSRPEIRCDLMSHANKPAQYLDGLIDELDKWNGH
jgi:hypothetical protein